MLEKLISDLIIALNANTEALKSGSPKQTRTPKAEKAADAAPATTTPPAEPAAPTPPALTQQDVINAATALMDANGNDGSPLTPMVAKYGVKRIREVPADKYAEVIAALNALTAAAKAAPAV